jgi:hypothetical protein
MPQSTRWHQHGGRGERAGGEYDASRTKVFPDTGTKRGDTGRPALFDQQARDGRFRADLEIGAAADVRRQIGPGSADATGLFVHVDGHFEQAFLPHAILVG